MFDNKNQIREKKFSAKKLSSILRRSVLKLMSKSQQSTCFRRRTSFNRGAFESRWQAAEISAEANDSSKNVVPTYD